MCQDIEHGGARCLTDTSAARRYRRKAATILAASSPVVEEAETIEQPKVTVFPVASASMVKLKEMAAEIKKEAYASIPEGETQASWDAKVEVKITALGKALGKEADKIAGLDSKVTKKELEESSEILLKTHYDKGAVISKKLRAYDDQWKAIKENHKDESENSFSRFLHVENLTEKQRALLDEEEMETVKKLDELVKEENIHDEKSQEIYKKIQQHKEKTYHEANTKLTAAYLEVLSQIRPLGGEVLYNKDQSDVEAQKVFTSTIGKNYPEAWLQKHNESNGSNLKIAFNDTRPNYNRDALSETEEDGIPKTIPTTRRVTISNLADAERLKTIYETNPNSKVAIFQAKEQDGKQTYVMYVTYDEDESYSEETHGVLIDGKPTGEGWTYRASSSQLEIISKQKFHNQDEKTAFLEKKAWVRKITSVKKPEPKLSIYSAEEAKKVRDTLHIHNDYAAAVAYHEFGHRMEEVLPNNILPRQEKAFLLRRSKKTEKNANDKMTTRGMPSGEYAHDAKLVISYAGKDYFTEKNYEVFSVGIESLYGGNFGGLMGNTEDELKTDSDHRGFVLGALASL